SSHHTHRLPVRATPARPRAQILPRTHASPYTKQYSTNMFLASPIAYYTAPMAMGKRKRHANQASMWVATQDLPRSAAHPFYARLNQILDQHDFDSFVEGLCERFYADEGRPGL